MSAAAVQGSPSARRLWGFLAAMVVFWALNPIVGKVALRHIPAPLLVSIRTTFAAMFILPAVWFNRRKARPIARKDWPFLLLLGCVLQVGNQMLFVTGLDHTSVAHTVLIFSAVPIVILCLAAAIGQERITARKVAGMAVCAAGVISLSADRSGGGNPTLEGDLLLLVGALFFSSFTVFGKEQRRQYGAITLNAVAYCSGAVVLQPLIWIVYRDVDLSAAPAEAWWAILYMALFPAVLGYLIYYWALGHAPASRVAALQYLQPPLVTWLGWILLGESVGWTLATAGSAILVGVYLTERG